MARGVNSVTPGAEPDAALADAFVDDEDEVPDLLDRWRALQRAAQAEAEAQATMNRGRW